MSIEAMKRALEALDDKPGVLGLWLDNLRKARETLRQAIEQAEKQEPVAYPEGDVVGPCICGSWPGGKCLKCPRIASLKREWVGLTDKEARKFYEKYTNREELIYAIDKFLEEKNA